MPSKHFIPDSIYRDRAGTRYTVTYEGAIGYYLIRLQPNNVRISNSITVFPRWPRELTYVGPIRNP